MQSIKALALVFAAWLALPSTLSATEIQLSIQNGGQQATVRVRDNGGGIAPERLDRVFNPFFTTKPNGTGLGMAIARKVVEAHGGTIDVASTPGQGTEFAVALPLPR